ERVGLALSAPVWFTGVSPSGDVQGAGLGDMKLYAPISVVLDDEALDVGFGLSVIPLMHIPAGTESRMLGNGGFGGGVLVAPGYRLGDLRIELNVGVEANPSMAFENLRGGANLLTALGASYRINETLAARTEVRFDPSLKPNTVPLTESPGELLPSLRGRYNSGLSWTLGGATGLTPGVSAARYRMFAAVGWTFGKSARIDTDLDGYWDSEDTCPLEPETFNTYNDLDGCPDALASLSLVVNSPEGKLAPELEVYMDDMPVGRTDENGNIVLNEFDGQRLIPNEQHTLTVEPNLVTGMEPQEITFVLEEGENHKVIDLLWRPGSVMVITRTDTGAIPDAVVAFLGPVAREAQALGQDGEEIFVFEPGDWTLLIAAATFGTERHEIHIEPDQRSLIIIEVTMEPAVVEVTEGEVMILEQILFEFDRDQIKEESLALVDEISATLLSHPELTSIEVQGHSDSRGNSAYNRKLSQRRVDSVVAALVNLGVAVERLKPVGYGEDIPIASNSSDEGRAKNRRVQFIILEPTGEEDERKSKD
ncbi:MAG: OmpA family protein, partial [Rhodobacterales bacterium]|nr:OmpA family protein [Rhodobacterales bacterium]